MILKQALIKPKKNGAINDYEILVNSLDSITIRYDHDNKKINFCNNGLPLNFDTITQKYSDDYFDNFTKDLIKKSIELLKMLNDGKFEYDTLETDCILHDIRRLINNIDV